jgi:hypothetical protein
VNECEKEQSIEYKLFTQQTSLYVGGDKNKRKNSKKKHTEIFHEYLFYNDTPLLEKFYVRIAPLPTLPVSFSSLLSDNCS